MTIEKFSGKYRTRNLSHVLDEEDYFEKERAEYESPFKVGDIVRHPVFGEGKIVSANKDFTSFECSSTAGPPGRSGQGSSPRQTYPTECQRGKKARKKAKTGRLLSRYFYVNLQYGYK